MVPEVVWLSYSRRGSNKDRPKYRPTVITSNYSRRRESGSVAAAADSVDSPTYPDNTRGKSSDALNVHSYQRQSNMISRRPEQVTIPVSTSSTVCYGALSLCMHQKPVPILSDGTKTDGCHLRPASSSHT
jgi:hypothetical protein